MITTNIKLSGLNCSACKKIVEKRFRNISGIIKIVVNLQDGNVELMSKRPIERSELIKSLEGTDFQLVS